MSDLDLFNRWPGKSPLTAGGPSHPAVYHMLDVASVAEILIDDWALTPATKDLFVLLVGLHDLGKIGVPFRAMLERSEPQTVGSHWEVTEAYLYLFDRTFLGQALGGYEDVRKELYSAIAGHHGRPSKRDLELGRNGHSPAGDWKRMLTHAGEEALKDAETVVRRFLRLWPNGNSEGLGPNEAIVLSWRIAGLTTAADWIASNVDWFPPIAVGPTIEQYLSIARSRAQKAVASAGLSTPAPSFGPLFNFPLRALQTSCRDVPLTSGPMIAVLEDEPGSGKTEAALILANRMMIAGKARGLYFALPTMATADAMFSRVADVVGRLYVSEPSLALAHGRARLSGRFRQLIDRPDENCDEPGAGHWLADNRRRALMADVGVGTVDQALMAVVRAKHAALRQFGLSSKILIVDEVHEMGDPYMGELLAKLLHVHAALGGSAILLSATIPLALRKKLVSAFETGAGRYGFTSQSSFYPALTLPGVDVPVFQSTAVLRGPVTVKRLADSNVAIDLLQKSTEQGAACVWVRNSVDDAISAVHILRERGVKADLLHARFALVDRKRHEQKVLSLYGKQRQDRPGRVLIATQVVESSLDLDFDVMVSDLAPMAALIQRAGRLWRHMDLRPVRQRPVHEPVLHVVSPDPGCVESEGWLQTVLGGGAFVYPLALQWRSARVLFDVGKIDAPWGLRTLIENAHGETIPVPSALERAEIRALGEAGAGVAHAGQNLIDWNAGYRAGASGAGDADYPTRLGEPQAILVLARRVGGQIVPWSGGSWTVEACQMSEVQASKRRVERLGLPDQQSEEIRAVMNKLPGWLASSRLVCPIEGQEKISGQVTYESELGLRFLADSI